MYQPPYYQTCLFIPPQTSCGDNPVPRDCLDDCDGIRYFLGIDGLCKMCQQCGEGQGHDKVVLTLSDSFYRPVRKGGGVQWVRLHSPPPPPPRFGIEDIFCLFDMFLLVCQGGACIFGSGAFFPLLFAYPFPKSKMLCTGLFYD